MEAYFEKPIHDLEEGYQEAVPNVSGRVHIPLPKSLFGFMRIRPRLTRISPSHDEIASKLAALLKGDWKRFTQGK